MRAITLCVLVPLYSCSSPQPTHQQTSSPTLIRAELWTGWDSIAEVIAERQVHLTVQTDDEGLYWQLDAQHFRSPDALQQALQDHSGPLLIHTGPSITYADVARTLDIVTETGVTDIAFASKQEDD